MRVSPRRPGRLTLAFLLALTSFPAVAGAAEFRGGTSQDPQDTAPPLSGPRNVDFRSVGVVYNSDGSLTATVTVWEPYPATTMTYPSLYLPVGMDDPSLPAAVRCKTYAPGALTLTSNFEPQGGPGTFTVQGFQGSLPLTRTISADGLTYTFSATAPQIAGQDYRCVGEVEAYRRDPDGHCSPSINNCQRISYSYVGDTVPTFWFDGFAPPPPPPPTPQPQCDDNLDNDGDGDIDWPLDDDCQSSSANTEAAPPKAVCANGIDDDKDGKTDLKDPGCYGKKSGASEQDPAPVASTSRVTRLRATRKCTLETEVSVLPDIKPLSVFPFHRVRVTVKGVSGKGRKFEKTRRLPLGEHNGYVFKRLKPGRYRVTAFYPGDRWRTSSKSKPRTVKVC